MKYIKGFNENNYNENIEWQFDNEEEKLEPNEIEVKEIEKYLEHNYPVHSEYIDILDRTVNFIFLKDKYQYIGLNGFSSKRYVRDKLYLEIKDDIQHKYSEPSLRKAIKNFINNHK